MDVGRGDARSMPPTGVPGRLFARWSPAILDRRVASHRDSDRFAPKVFFSGDVVFGAGFPSMKEHAPMCAKRPGGGPGRDITSR
jgi:hypothetical protein